MSREKGFFAEERTSRFLIEKGFEIVERNFFSRYGEIDIIAKKNGVLHFIEVKSGINFNPIYAITPKKIQKILKTLQYYFLIHSLEQAHCIDVVCVSGNDIFLLENIAF